MLDINELKFDEKGLIPAIIVETKKKKVLSTAEGWILILLITAVVFVIGMTFGTRISFKGNLLTPDYAYEQKGLTIDHVEVKTEDGKTFRLYKREEGE